MANFGTLEQVHNFPGEPPIPYRQWRKTVIAYIERKGFTISRLPVNVNAAGDQQPPTYTDKEKNLDVFMHLGTEGRRLYDGTPDAENFDRPHDEFMKVLDDLFRAPINRLVGLQNFRNYCQSPNQTAVEFLAELRNLAKDCGFQNAAAESAEIADALILNCRDRDCQKKLFTQMATVDRPTIEQVMNIMKAEETSKSNIRQLKGDTRVSTAATIKHRLKNSHEQSRSSKDSAKPTSEEVHSEDSQKSDKSKPVTCFGCGESGHFLYAKQCPAKGKRCNFCNGMGHFEARCRKKQQAGVSLRNSKNIAAADTRIHLDLFVKPVGKTAKPLKFLVDTGAEVSTIQHSNVSKLFGSMKLLPTDVTLDSFSGRTVKPKGIFTAEVLYHGRHAEANFFVVEDSCLQLLGIPELSQLEIHIDAKNRSVAAEKVATENLLSPDKLMDDLVREFPNLFSEGIGLIPNFEHKIKLKPNSVPIRCKMRHPPVALADDSKTALDELLHLDVIEQIDKSEYVHPLHFIRKPDGSIRTTVDFSVGLNKHVIPSSYPLPLPKDIFNKLKDAKFFSKLDITKGYHHMLLAPESRPLTAFITPSHGLCQFKRVPMGLVDSGAAFQRQMEQTLVGLEGVDAYIDDVIIYGKTRTEHDNRLKKVLSALQAHEFRLKRSKVSICQTEISILGHQISASESGVAIKPDPRNASSFKHLKEPTSVAEVRSFLGVCNFYNNHIPKYAEIVEPLINLTRKAKPFVFDELCRKSFDVLKCKIANPQLLAPFNPKLVTYLTTDASDVGLGAMLSQRQDDGTERPVAFAAKTLTSTERNYSTPEHEALACVWGSEHFFKFLFGRKFTLRTDQALMKTLMNRFSENRTSKRIARWYDRIRHMDYEVEYIRGKENCAADILSRLAADPESQTPTLTDDNDSIIIATVSAKTAISLETVRLETLKDPDLVKVQKWLKENSWPERKHVPAQLHSFYGFCNQLLEIEGLLFYGDRLIVPTICQPKILNLLHLGHPGVGRMREKYKMLYFWPGGSTDVKNFVNRCWGCSATGKNTESESVPVTPIAPPERPWQKAAIDICGPFITAPQSQRHIVVITDYFSKYPEMLLTNSITSTTIIKWLQEVFARFGNPDELVTDNGPQFTSSEFKDFLVHKNIRHNLTAVYNPTQNGLVEVFNRSIKNAAQIIAAEGGNFTDGMLDLLATFRSTPPENSLSPAKLMFGWNIRSDADIRNSKFLSGEGDSNPSFSVSQRKVVVDRKFEKRRYGQLRTNPKWPYRMGDWVTFRKPNCEVRKGENPRSIPLRITGVKGRWLYVLENGPVWNAGKLRSYRGEPVPEFDETEDIFYYKVRNNQNIHRDEQPTLRQSTRTTAGKPPDRWSPKL